MPPTADEIIRLLGLQPLPIEGGYFAETYRSGLTLPHHPTGEVETGERALATAIYYFLAPDTFSALHRLRSDEVYHAYLGDPVELVLLDPSEDGTHRAQTVILGSDIAAGQRPQVVVPAGAWQGSRLAPGGAYALLGTTMAPGYHPDDFELGDRASLAAQFPDHAALVTQLTR